MTNFQVDILVDAAHINMVFDKMTDALQPQSLADWLEDEIDPFVRRRIHDRFANEGDELTGPWLPLRSTTESFRISKGFPPSHPINVRTRYMQDFLTGTSGQVNITGVGAELTNPGSNPDPLTAIKIETAQRGKSYPNTPARPVLGLGDLDNLFIQNELVRHLFAGIK